MTKIQQWRKVARTITKEEGLKGYRFYPRKGDLRPGWWPRVYKGKSMKGRLLGYISTPHTKKSSHSITFTLTYSNRRYKPFNTLCHELAHALQNEAVHDKTFYKICRRLERKYNHLKC